MHTANAHVKAIKHMAFAVRHAETALDQYSRLLGAPVDAPIHEYAKSRTRVALFMLGGIEFQLCESMDEDGRFTNWIREHGGEGLHHICYEVGDIEAALADAVRQGATLRECKACKVAGAHAHPEGFVAFLDNDAGGIEIEFMQVYTAAELRTFRVEGV